MENGYFPYMIHWWDWRLQPWVFIARIMTQINILIWFWFWWRYWNILGPIGSWFCQGDRGGYRVWMRLIWIIWGQVGPFCILGHSVSLSEFIDIINIIIVCWLSLVGNGFYLLDPICKNMCPTGSSPVKMSLCNSSPPVYNKFLHKHC